MYTFCVMSTTVMYFSKYYKPWHLTPASSEWPLEQLTKELCGQSVRLLSLPVQSTLSRWIGPAPEPKWARPKDTAPVWYKNFQIEAMYIFVRSITLLTICGISKLLTHYRSISAIPGIITHSTPQIVCADLHSAFIWNVTSCQSQLTSCANSWGQ